VRRILELRDRHLRGVRLPGNHAPAGADRFNQGGPILLNGRFQP
jgi:hypothetical protein